MAKLANRINSPLHNWDLFSLTTEQIIPKSYHFRQRLTYSPAWSFAGCPPATLLHLPRSVRNPDLVIMESTTVKGFWKSE